MNDVMTPAEKRRWVELGSGNGGAIANNDRWPGSENFCEDLAKRGLAKCYDCMFGNDYYTLTKKGELAFYGG